MKIKFVGLKTLAILDQNALALAYQTVYASEPWSEWKKCPQCNKNWGIEKEQEIAAMKFRHCDTQIEDYWPTNDLLADFASLSTKPEFTASIAYDTEKGKVIGFCWGHQVFKEELDSKLELPGIGERVSNLTVDSKPLIYLSDIAVDGKYREQGIAKKLISDFFDQNAHHSLMLTRTKAGSNPSVSNAWFYRLGFELLATYDDRKGREIQVADIQALLKR
jgi:ribosomal protein S18 acetylase RimI-like enzyme